MTSQDPKTLVTKPFSWVSSTIASGFSRIWNSSSNQKSEEKKSMHQQTESQPLPSLQVRDKKAQVIERLRSERNNGSLQRKMKKINDFFSKNMENQEEKPEQLLCPICIDFLSQSIVTICGHSFCYRCLDESLLFSASCPVCRSIIRGTNLSKCNNIDSIILRWISKFDKSESTLIFLKNRAQSIEWEQNRRVNGQKLKEGDIIDVRDTQFIWCEAKVTKIFFDPKQNSKMKRVNELMVHYIGWNCVYDEIISLNSQRLASKGFYTSRKDIPHYFHVHQNAMESMQSYVVIGDQMPILQQIPIELEIEQNIEPESESSERNLSFEYNEDADEQNFENNGQQADISFSVEDNSGQIEEAQNPELIGLQKQHGNIEGSGGMDEEEVCYDDGL